MIDIVLFGIFVALIIVWFLRKDGRRKGRRIPGPRGVPYFGCAFEVNLENIHVKFSEYARKYGDIFQVKIMNTTLIGLNSEKLIKLAASEDGYKQYLNDRPRGFYGDMFYYNSQSTFFCEDGYSADHNAYRKGLTKAVKFFSSGRNSVFQEKIITEVKSGLMKKIESSKGGDIEIVSELFRSMSNTFSCLLIGKPFSENDPNSDIFKQFCDSSDNFLSNALAGDFLGSYPFLRFIPGLYRKQFTQAMKARDAIVEIYFKEQKESYVPGVRRGVVDYFLEEQRKDKEAGEETFFTDERILGMLLETIAAGILGTWSSLANIFHCLINHPQYQDKMFEELDRVIGRDRDININDQAKCPFIEAVELEVQRYLPIVTVLDPKVCRVDLDFEGYDLPKGSIICANVWYIYHKEKIWGDPWNFRPERWLDEQGNLVSRDHVYRKNWLPFGYGRRQCVGESFGRSSNFLYVATLLRRWKFVASPGKQRSCDPRDQANIEMKATVRPKPFYCHVQERY